WCRFLFLAMTAGAGESESEADQIPLREPGDEGSRIRLATRAFGFMRRESRSRRLDRIEAMLARHQSAPRPLKLRVSGTPSLIGTTPGTRAPRGSSRWRRA